MKKLILILLSVLLIASCAGMQKQPEPKTEQQLKEQFEEDLRAAAKSGAKWSTYASMGAGNIADGDDFMVRDIDDTDPWATGEQKLYTWANLLSDLTNITKFVFPNSASETLDEDGEAAVDISDDQLIYRGDTNTRVLSYKNRFCFTLEDPTDADDSVPVFSHEDAITVTDMRCWAQGGTNVIMYLTDGADDLDSMTCVTTGTNDDGAIANATFTADEQMGFDITSVSGAVDWLNYCFTYTITQE